MTQDEGKEAPVTLRAAAGLALVPLLALTACQADPADGGGGEQEGATATDEADDVEATPGDDPAGRTVDVEMIGAEGEPVGNVVLIESADAVIVEATLSELEPGFHGFHVHEHGECDPEHPEGPFDSAGGHHDPGGADHGEHAGDLPPLLVGDDGTAVHSVRTDRVSVDELVEDDGSALVVHEDPDNLGHVPDRYTSEDADEPGPDEETRDTGDAGGRAACGVVDDEAVQDAPG